MSAQPQHPDSPSMSISEFQEAAEKIADAQPVIESATGDLGETAVSDVAVSPVPEVAPDPIETPQQQYLRELEEGREERARLHRGPVAVPRHNKTPAIKRRSSYQPRRTSPGPKGMSRYVPYSPVSDTSGDDVVTPERGAELARQAREALRQANEKAGK